MTLGAALGVFGEACIADGPTERDPGRIETEPRTFAGPRVEATTTTAPGVVVEASGPIACADPSLRTAAHYRRLQAPTLPTRSVELWGAGLISGDLTGDGHHDLFLVGETGHQLWVTRPDADPEEVDLLQIATPWLDAIDLDDAVGGTVADLDGDGWLDLVIARWGRPNALLRNLGGIGFEDITPDGMRGHAWRTQSATVADLDGDGDLDLFFGSYGDDPPAFDQYMAPAEPAELYENAGGTWVDRSGDLPQEVHDGYTFASGAWDLDGDGLPELVLSNDFGKIRPSVVARNRGALVFEADTTWHPGFEDMGVGVGDLNGDEVPDFLITSWRTISLLLSGDATGMPGVWFDGATAAGIVVNHEPPLRQDFGWGTELGDLDNDGDLDAVVLHGDWDTWPADSAEIDGAWIQTGPLVFEDRAAWPEWDLDDGGDARAVGLLDLNGDGWLDVLKRHANQPSGLSLSRCGTEGWLRVELAAPAPNTRGIGAKVAVEAGGKRQVRWIAAGSTGLYSGQPPEAHFGLGGAEVVDRLEITWPDGEVSAFDGLEARQRIRAVRP